MVRRKMDSTLRIIGIREELKNYTLGVRRFFSNSNAAGGIVGSRTFPADNTKGLFSLRKDYLQPEPLMVKVLGVVCVRDRFDPRQIILSFSTRGSSPNRAVRLQFCKSFRS
jgi:hypothetical protein